MVRRTGSLVTVAFSGEVKGILTTDDLAQQISESLQNAGFSVRSISIETPVWTNVFTGAWVHYTYTGSASFALGWDTDDDELTGAITNAALAITGLMPTAFSVRGATDTEAQPTGSATSAGMFSSVTSAIQQVGWGIVLLVGLLVALLVFRPDIGRLAA